MKVDLNCKVVNTKVDNHSYDLLKLIAKEKGISIYTFLQVVTNSFLQHFADESKISHHAKKLIESFVNLSMSKNGFSLIEPNKKKQYISSIICIVGKERRTLTHPLLVRNDEKKGITECMNSDQILSEFMMALDFESLERLQVIKKENDYLSLTDALKHAINNEYEVSRKKVDDEIAELFADNNRATNGKGIDYSEFGRYKRKHRKSVG